MAYAMVLDPHDKYSRLDRAGRKRPLYGSHRHTVVASSSVDVLVVGMTAFSIDSLLFQAMLDIGSSKYCRLLKSDNELLLEYYQKRLWSLQKRALVSSTVVAVRGMYDRRKGDSVTSTQKLEALRELKPPLRW